MPKILIVEDEAPNVEILTRLLSRKNYELVVAGNKEDAIALAESEQPNLILMDIGIPDSQGASRNDSGGLEATRELKSVEATRSIPMRSSPGKISRNSIRPYYWLRGWEWTW